MSEQSASTPEKGTPNSASAAELKEVFSGPAFFVNKTYISASGLTARITFTEQRENDTPAFRTAVVMTIGDLVALHVLLNRVLASTQELKPTTTSSGDNG